MKLVFEFYLNARIISLKIFNQKSNPT